MGKNWNTFVNRNPNWPLLFVPLLPLCCLAWYLFLTIGTNNTYNPSWSPTGDMIAFECVYLTKEDSRGFEPIYDFRLRDICVKWLGVRKSERLTNYRSTNGPAWSSDGRYLAWFRFNEDTWNEEIVIWDSLNNSFNHYPSENNIEFDDYAGDYLLWINDDAQISLQGMGAILDIQAGRFEYINDTFGDREIVVYSMSPNGEFAYISYSLIDEKDEEDQLSSAILSKDHTVIKELIKTTPSYEIPAWTVDGNYVAWVSKGYQETGYSEALMISSCHSGETIKISFPGLRDISDPVWSNDSDRIVFSSFSDELHIVDLEIDEESFDIEVIRHNIQHIPKKRLNSPISLSPDGDRATLSKEYFWGEGKVVIIDLGE